MTQLFRGLDPAPMVAEIQARIGEELDYGIEAANQQAFADFYVGHPFIHVPAVIDALSTDAGADYGAGHRRDRGPSC